MRVSFLRPCRVFSDAGNYTQHQEARFHKIIASRPKQACPERSRRMAISTTLKASPERGRTVPIQKQNLATLSYIHIICKEKMGFAACANELHTLPGFPPIGGETLSGVEPHNKQARKRGNAGFFNSPAVPNKGKTV
jgi:hypothetical protein